MEIASFVFHAIPRFLVELGGLAAGVAVLWQIVKFLRAGQYAIELVNVDARYFYNDPNRPNLITGVHLLAIFTNSGTAKGFVGVDKVETIIVGGKAKPDPVAWRTLVVGPNIAVNLGVDSINVRIPQGDYRQGRIDWRLKVGASADKLDQDFIVKGVIGINTTGTRAMMLWTPDDTSEHPVGMKVGAAGYDQDMREVGDRLSRERPF